MNDLKLRYGMNPHQGNAKIYSTQDLPIEIISGSPGYINLLDALNSWQLVKELKTALNQAAAASFKHVSPAGAAIGKPLSSKMKKVYHVENIDLSPLASAYARARGADRVSSYGDWAALSDIVDEPTALILKQEVSDGVIAPGYTKEALEILKAKKRGKYNIILIDENYLPGEVEKRTLFGINFEQNRNDRIPDLNDLGNIVTQEKDIPEEAIQDLILSMITLKYTQSNSVCYARDGQITGCGAGQQSRIHCTRLAADKSDLWYLRQHEAVLNLKFRKDLKNAEKDNAIDTFLRDDITDKELTYWKEAFEVVPKRLTSDEKAAWILQNREISLASDAFFPFRDNIDRAAASGVKYIAQPGGSIRDDVVINACNEYRMVMAFTGLRLFHH